MSLRAEYNSSGTTYLGVTLAESLSAITFNETFYFVFTYENDDTEYTKSLRDQSPAPMRWNKFPITTITGDTSSGNIGFLNEGWYKYEVYKDSNKTTLLEMGKMYIFNDDTPNSSVYSVDTDKYVYKK